MMRLDWGEVAATVVPAFTVALVATGLYVAYQRPPRQVADRFWQWETEYHSECTAHDDKGSCTHTREWTTQEKHYYAVSVDGAKCDVGFVVYVTMKKGQPVKCWQLFGWSGGTASDSAVVASMPREATW